MRPTVQTEQAMPERAWGRAALVGGSRWIINTSVGQWYVPQVCIFIPLRDSRLFKWSAIGEIKTLLQAGNGGFFYDKQIYKPGGTNR
ncbi:MAG TPA: hypothetical protein DC038_04415 [Clostridiales bacterium]|nr:hypothetical protein [Clostridiales bacterium]